MKNIYKVLTLCLLFCCVGQVNAQVVTGSTGSTVTPYLWTGIGGSGTATVTTTGTGASFGGPSWGSATGMTFTVQNTGAAQNCVYYGMKLPAVGDFLGVSAQCTNPASVNQAWSLVSNSGNVVTMQGPATTLLNGGTVTPRIVLTFSTTVYAINNYFITPFVGTFTVNVKVLGNFSGLGPGGTGTTGSYVPLLDQYNQGHYNNSGTAGICTGFKLAFYQMVPALSTPTVVSPVCSNLTNAEIIGLSASNGVTPWNMDF